VINDSRIVGVCQSVSHSGDYSPDGATIPPLLHYYSVMRKVSLLVCLPRAHKTAERIEVLFGLETPWSVPNTDMGEPGFDAAFGKLLCQHVSNVIL